MTFWSSLCLIQLDNHFVNGALQSASFFVHYTQTDRSVIYMECHEKHSTSRWNELLFCNGVPKHSDTPWIPTIIIVVFTAFHSAESLNPNNRKWLLSTLHPLSSLETWFQEHSYHLIIDSLRWRNSCSMKTPVARYAKFPPFPQKLGQPLGRCFEAHTTLFRRYVISGYDPARLVQSSEHKNSTVRNRLRIYVCLSGKVVLAPEPVSSPCSQWNTMQRVNQLLSMAGGLRWVFRFG